MRERDNKGFTIVEVMIVLAIAGLIMAVIFIAVPALQRSQRNNGRAADANYLLTQYQQAVANNGGRALTNAAEFDALIHYEELNHLGRGKEGKATKTNFDDDTEAGGVVAADAADATDVALEEGKISFVGSNGVTKNTAKRHTIGVADNMAVIYQGYTCGNITIIKDSTDEIKASAAVSGSSTDAALWYLPEGSKSWVCVDI